MTQLRLLAACLLLSSPCLAATVHLRADLAGTTEVPPTTSDGHGTAEATLDTVSGKLDWTLTWRQLSGPATMAHFHGPAVAGQNAPVVVPLGTAPTSPLSGTTMLKPEAVAQLTGGQWYANVHTAQFPKGAIRGQMTIAR